VLTKGRGVKAKAGLVAHGSSELAPGSPDQTSDRRVFLVRASKVTAGTIALSLAPGVARADTARFYELDPGTNCDCTTCKACKRHSRNKIFATRSAADLGRAHPGCDCKVVQKAMRGTCFNGLFGPKGDLKRTSVDKRWRWVHRILKECR
jgi:hypothetical protein